MVGSWGWAAETRRLCAAEEHKWSLGLILTH